MEKLSAKEFDENLEYVLNKFNNALQKANKTKDDVILLAATKTVDVDTINYAISKGVVYVGENKVQEVLAKHDNLTEVHEHFIGHLQTNKVKDIIDKVELIQSVDSIKLAKEISKQATKRGITMKILLEVNIGGEESKWGFKPDEVENAVREISNLSGIKICGLMTIPPICEEEHEVRKYFRQMYKLFIDIGSKNIDNSSMDILSMGMSDDFDIAIEEGANLVRVGTALFGKRNYNV
jgi:pyridoxal phosphate enzyme (YggS family)